MWHRDGKDLIPLQFPFHKLIDRFSELQLAETVLDRNFPDTRHADKRLVLGVPNGSASEIRQSVVAAGEPQEGVSIQEQAHYMYSAKSSSGALKSSAISTFPRALPNRRGGRASPAALTLATGFPSQI